jgi:hypothetical protein
MKTIPIGNAMKTKPVSRLGAITLQHLKYLALGVLVFLLALGALRWKAQHDRAQMRAKLDQQLASLRAASLPVSPADLRRLFPDPPPEDDAPWASVLRSTATRIT